MRPQGDHRRRDPTTGEWRRFPGRDEPERRGACPLCSLPPFDVAVVGQRSAAGGSAARSTSTSTAGLYQSEPWSGAEEVVVWSEDHGASLADVGPARLARVVEVWADRYGALGSREDVGYVLISQDAGKDHRDQPHPHARVAASPDVPPPAQLELTTAASHFRAQGTCVFCDVVARERRDGVRIVAQNASFLAFVPFAARAACEVHVLPLRHAASLLDLTDPERDDLAGILAGVLASYARPYRMVVHQAPTDDGQWQSVSHFHVELAPASPGPPVLPEEAASALREQGMGLHRGRLDQHPLAGSEEN